ncbi:DUF2199 domain-containing protein [Streptomyces sp. NPDC003863]
MFDHLQGRCLCRLDSRGPAGWRHLLGGVQCRQQGLRRHDHQPEANVHTRPIGERPLVELEPTDHVLAVEQRAGITMDRVREIAKALLYGASGESG